ncbi:MAG: altronate dehydratase family protein [Beijerinckiaceae bacterium]|nr:altronate dehydratase family protein [Beijerinckiaceae bacterium]
MSVARVIRLDPADNVAVAASLVAAGETIFEGVTASEEIGSGHKVALRAIAAGEPVLKFGQVIGEALVDIAPGALVHTPNLGFRAGLERLAANAAIERRPSPNRQTFMGFRRPSGKVGTRNYVGVIASVNCSATVCRAIAERAERELLPSFPNVDGFVPIVHGQGCGSSAGGEGLAILRRTLSGYARHPNFAAVLLIGLGCEVNQIALYGAASKGAAIESFNIQDVGGTRAAIEMALEKLKVIAARANETVRESAPVSELMVGLQCGGSDGFSGITANPALGVAMDMLVAGGGTAVLSETPEIYGAEHLLTSRAEPEVAEKLMTRIRWWEAYTAANNASLDNNPSPGNKRGGLTTILEKSLGAVAKAGRSPLSDVVEYAVNVKSKGLVFMDTPGYDPVSATGQVAGGANVIVFTTGRGSCFGCRPSPSIKVASNPELFARMPEDMDIDAGKILNGEASVEQVGAEIYEHVLDVASGLKTASETFGYGDNEFVPWSIGAVL